MTPYEVKKNKDKVGIKVVRSPFEVRINNVNNPKSKGGCGCGGGK